MRAFANAAESIESGDAERRGKVAVRATAGGRFLQAHAEFLGAGARLLKQTSNGGRSFHGWAIQTTLHLNGAAFVEGTQRSELFVEDGGVLYFREADGHVNAPR